MKARGRTDSELLSILEHVHLEYLPSREGGWETRKEWKDVLSYVPSQSGRTILIIAAAEKSSEWAWHACCESHRRGLVRIDV